MSKINWKLVPVGALVASLGLAACGAQATLNQALSSVDASPYLQMHVTASVSGSGSGVTQAQKVLSLLSYDVSEVSTTGSPLSSSAGKIDSEVKVEVGSQSLVDLREVGTNVYVYVDLTALAKIPGADVSSQELATLQLILGGRWFEIPESLLNSYAKAPKQDPAKVAQDQADVQQLIKSLTKVIEATKYTTLPGGGFAQTGKLATIAKALLPTIDQMSGRQLGSGAVPGTYKIGVTLSGTTATGGSIEITAPNGTAGNETVGLNATIAHQSLSIDAPSGATVITPQLLKGLEGQLSPASTSSISSAV